MPQVAWAACVCGIWQIRESAVKTVADQQGAKSRVDGTGDTGQESRAVDWVGEED